MDHLQSSLPRPHTQIIYQSAQPKILASSSTNFARAPDPNEMQFYYERPMMLNAWTQTTYEDFEYLKADNIHYQQQHQRIQQQSQNERKLLEKIRILEENLRAHSEILSQIHVTSGRKNPLQQNRQQSPSPEHRIISPTNSTSLINHVQQGHAESVKYTIIAEGDGNENGEPIEIQLAEEDGAINLNSSADSGRLEIVLSDEAADVKNEMIPKSETLEQTNSTPPMEFIKRRKIEKTPTDVNLNSKSYNFNEQSMATPPTINGIVPGSAQTAQMSNYQKVPVTPRLNNSLLKANAIAVADSHTSQSIAQQIPKVSRSPLPELKTPVQSQSFSQKIDMDNVMVSIGPNNTRIPAKVYENMSWASASIATRKLLMAIFDRKTLATHSMTGKPSPAFKDHGKPLKQMLDPMIVQDIIFVVTRKCNVSEKEVRNAITTKCADENKMMKLQMNKHRMLKEFNKENVLYSKD